MHFRAYVVPRMFVNILIESREQFVPFQPFINPLSGNMVLDTTISINYYQYSITNIWPEPDSAGYPVGPSIGRPLV